MDPDEGSALYDSLRACPLTALAESRGALSALLLVAGVVRTERERQLVDLVSRRNDPAGHYLVEELRDARREMASMERMLQKHDAALGILSTDVAATRTAVNLREELNAERLATAKVKDHAQALQDQLHQMRLDSQEERAGLALREDHITSVAILSETAVQIKVDEITLLKEEIDALHKQEAKLRAERDQSRDDLVEGRARFEDLLEEARADALRERRDRIDAEKALQAEILTLKDEVRAARRETHSYRIAAEFSEKDRVTDTSEAAQRAEATRLEAECLNAELTNLRQQHAQAAAVSKSEREIEAHRVAGEMRDMQAALDDKTRAYEAIYADFQVQARALEDAERMLGEKKKECVDLAVKVKVLENQRAHDKADAEDRLSAVEERATQRTKTLEARLAMQIAEHSKKSEEYIVIHNKLKAEVAALQRGIEDKETSITRLDGHVAGTGDLLAAEKVAHGMTAAKLERLEAEVSRREKVTDSVKDNFHYRILHDQHQQRCDEVKYLRDKITGLEFKLQSMHVDSAVIPRVGRGGMGSAGGSRGEGAGQPTATPLHFKRRLEMAELTSRSLDDLLRTVLEELKKPVPVTLRDESSTRPDSRANQWEEGGSEKPPPLLHLLTPGTQRDLALLADAEARRPIQEPTWLDPLGPPKGPLAPLPMTPPKEDANNTFAGLPKHHPGTVDSSSYFTTQRKKLVPSVYDLDWW